MVKLNAKSVEWLDLTPALSSRRGRVFRRLTEGLRRGWQFVEGKTEMRNEEWEEGGQGEWPGVIENWSLKICHWSLEGRRDAAGNRSRDGRATLKAKSVEWLDLTPALLRKSFVCCCASISCPKRLSSINSAPAGCVVALLQERENSPPAHRKPAAALAGRPAVNP